MGSYRQQPGASPSEVRKDGKRVAGKQVFPPPGSGGSEPKMRPRDLDYIPETVGGREPKPAGDHIHDRDRTDWCAHEHIPVSDGGQHPSSWLTRRHA